MTITSSLGKARHRYSVDLWISRSVRFSALLLFAFFFTFSIDALNIPIERMAIDPFGNVLIGKTTQFGIGNFEGRGVFISGFI